MALRLMMMHHNIKFGNQMFGGLEDIIWTNIDMNTVIQSFHMALWLMMYHQTMFVHQRINSSADIIERVIL